jgi:hypothetical protein
MTPDEQLEQWVKGISVHNDERDECCPDFSCCSSELMAPANERELFSRSGEAERMDMLSVFLGRLVV